MKLSVPRFDGHTVLVMGDVMLDRYWHGDNVRMSPEAPVPVVQVDVCEDRPGGAANVALNVVALGAGCVLIGAVGDDAAGVILRAKLEAAGVQVDFLTVPGWSTITKLRVFSRQQQLLRLDFESPLPDLHAVELLKRMERWMDHVDAVVLEDYDKGVLANPEAVLAALGGRRVPVVVDPKFKPLARYRGATLIKPNLLEFQRQVGVADSDAEFELRARQLMQLQAIPAMVITRGAAGMTVLEENQASVHLPARQVAVFDAIGAGDTVAATLAVALAAGATLVGAAALANVAAGLAVSRPGTVAVSAPELVQAVALDKRAGRGVLTVAQLQRAVAAAQAVGERIVFTNGCFDILHAGHVGYLKEARALGDRLIVAVNADASVRRLKGAGRPVNPLAQRMAVLAALAAVDWVVSFDADTPEELLTCLRPDVLAKGGDYQLDEVVGAALVRAWGGDVKVLSVLANYSTTAILARASGVGAAGESEQSD